ncbi:MAG: NUDIX domain-containing protein [Saprospiraceae bacterium]|nr:NUDIX domain-containing protein [Saprospiraceae bacterium]
MYTIYINETPLLLKEAAGMPKNSIGDAENIVARYAGKPKHMSGYIDMLEKTNRFHSITLYAEDYEKLVRDFFSLFKLIEAAGGLVLNPAGEILFIYRRGFWDLPKGKIDEGESPSEAAVREVHEETGIKQLDLGAELKITYHTYREKDGRRILKRTYWYRMKTETLELHPQAEEDIEEAIWMSVPVFFSGEKKRVYRSILDVLRA